MPKVHGDRLWSHHSIVKQVETGKGMTYEEINEWLRAEENRIGSMNAHPSQEYKGYALPMYASLSAPTGVVRVGSGRKSVVTDPFLRRRMDANGWNVRPEFPEGGDPRFRAVLAEMLTIHISKSHDYGTGVDIYANYRSAEAIGIPAWKSCFLRALEKVQRLSNAFGGKALRHEGVSDSFLDLANHIVISKVLYDEANPKG